MRDRRKELKMYHVTRIGKEIICQGIGKPYDASFWRVRNLMTGKVMVVQGRDNLYRRFRPWRLDEDHTQQHHWNEV
jgi:hypothetical protein